MVVPAEIDALANDIRKAYPSYLTRGAAAQTLIAQAKEIERLKTALEWYAEPELTYAITQRAEPRSAVHADGGKRAREALNN